MNVEVKYIQNKHTIIQTESRTYQSFDEAEFGEHSVVVRAFGMYRVVSGSNLSQLTIVGP